MPVMTEIQLLEKVEQSTMPLPEMSIGTLEVEDKLFQECQCVDMFLRNYFLWLH
jgi:hypothetical protein